MQTNNHKTPLTTPQLRFITAYVETLDPTKSAEIAGYSKINLKNHALELLQNPRIQAKIHERLEQFPAMLRVNRAFIVKKLFDIISASCAVEDVFDKQGNPTGTKIKDPATALRALDALSRCYTRVTDAQDKPVEDFRVLCIENLDNSKL